MSRANPDAVTTPPLTERQRETKAPNGQQARVEVVAARVDRSEARPEPTPPAQRNGKPAKGGRALALFCYEAPDSPVGAYIGNLATALAKRPIAVHLFSRQAFNLPGVKNHALGVSKETDLFESVHEFGQRAGSAFRKHIPAETQVTLLGHEWTAIAPLVQLRLREKLDAILLLQSLERQRSDLSSDLSKKIEELELAGLRDAGAILVHDHATEEAARNWVPECGSRLARLREPFATAPFAQPLEDPGEVKARYQIGPTDPTVLFIGDLDDRHGADVLMKSIPAVLKNTPQARFVFVGDGDLLWPLRVHARYLLLEPVVRLVGSLKDQPLHELIRAADIIAVPSREATEWWQVQIAWAAGKPAVVSHPIGEAMKLQHEKDSVLVYPHESSCVWGLERLLHDADLRATLGKTGRQELENRFGWSWVAQQIEELIGEPVAARS